MFEQLNSLVWLIFLFIFRQKNDDFSFESIPLDFEGPLPPPLPRWRKCIRHISFGLYINLSEFSGVWDLNYSRTTGAW